MSRLPDKTVIVTGASRGIGRSTALSLANEGAQVALLSRDQAALEEVASEVTRAGGRALVFPVDF
ncbi:MAG: SDR family NAD(P)-dependent oxidoreductase, partial [Verrucomicrobiota bacterium]|nr:SDR family NAD(P)-dependent oxidoreductase [Verrucomicrobiota bacterium]